MSDFLFDASAEDIKVFLDEADEMLQVMETDILKLETEGENPEYLQEIFRAAHTLKGSSATLGHKQMAELTHSMENVLDKLRKGKLSLSTAVVDTLFACLDVLKAFKQEIATGASAGVDTVAILSRLAGIDRVVLPPPSVAAAPAIEQPEHPDGVPALTPMEEARLADGVAQGLSPFWARLLLDPGTSMPAVRAFQVLLTVGDMGELVRSWPTQEEVEEDKVGEQVKVLFLTTLDIEKVREGLGGVPDLQLEVLSALPVPDSSTAEDPEGSPTLEIAADQAAAAVLAQPEAVHAGPDSPLRAQDPGGGSRGPAPRNSSRTVRVDVEVLDNLMNLVGELVIDRTRLLQVLTQLEQDRNSDDLTQVMAGALAHIGRMTSDLQEEIQRARMLPVDNLFKKFPRMVRDTAQKAGKEVEFIMLGEETELDRSVIEEIGDPLMHLLRNAVDHGVETPEIRVAAGKSARGRVVLEAFHEENHIIISVRDDGRGVDAEKIRASAVRKGLLTEEAVRRLTDQEAINLIWTPGFSTAEKVSDISGRGVGLDVVHKNLEKINGSVEIRTEVGKGTEFRVKLPLTLAIIRSLQVRVLEATYCIPLSSVVETDRIPVSSIQTVRGREVIVKRGDVLPLVRLIDAFQMERTEGYEEPGEIFVVIISVLGKQIGLVVDGLIGEGDVVIKPLGKFIGDVPGVSGATIMGDGDVAIILDVSSLVNIYQTEINRSEMAKV